MYGQTLTDFVEMIKADTLLLAELEEDASAIMMGKPKDSTIREIQEGSLKSRMTMFPSLRPIDHTDDGYYDIEIGVMVYHQSFLSCVGVYDHVFNTYHKKQLLMQQYSPRQLFVGAFDCFNHEVNDVHVMSFSIAVVSINKGGS